MLPKLRPAIIAGVLVLALGLVPGAAAPPRKAGPPRKALIDKLRGLYAKLRELHHQEDRGLADVRARFARELARFRGPEYRYESEIAKLRREEWEELRKAVDPVKAAAIRKKYASQVADLEKRIKAKDAEVEKINKRRYDEIARLESELRHEIERLDPPEDHLEARVARLRREERAELHRLIDPVKVKKIKAEYDARIDEVETKIRALRRESAEAATNRRAEVAAIERGLHDQMEKLDPNEDPLKARLAKLRAEHKAALDAGTTPEEKKAADADYQPQIKALQDRLKSLEAEAQQARHSADKRIEAIRGDYKAGVLHRETPLQQLFDELARLRREEREAIAKLVDRDKVKAIHDKYVPLIAELEKKIHGLDEEMERLTRKTRRAIEKVNAACDSEIAKLDPPPDRMEDRLLRLRAHERAELRRALDPAKVRAIHEQFEPRFAELRRKIRERDEEIRRLLLRRHEEMKEVSARFAARIHQVQGEIKEVLAQLSPPPPKPPTTKKKK